MGTTLEEVKTSLTDLVKPMLGKQVTLPASVTAGGVIWSTTVSTIEAMVAGGNVNDTTMITAVLSDR